MTTPPTDQEQAAAFRELMMPFHEQYGWPGLDRELSCDIARFIIAREKVLREALEKIFTMETIGYANEIAKQALSTTKTKGAEDEC